ncbi:MAG: methyltransferase domain-containing protein [Sphingobium sp.]
MLSKWREPAWLFDRAWAHTIGRLPWRRPHAPGITLLDDKSRIVVADRIDAHLAPMLARGERPSFIDFGARDGVRSGFARHCDYLGVDILPRGGDVIEGDVCHCPEIASDSQDVVFSFDLFEHVDRPWDAAAECIRVAKPGGLIVCRTLFAYRYHPEPNDYWRFSAQGLEHLFQRVGGVDTLVSAYDARERRRNRRGETLEQRPPIDWLGGWRENWQVLWIGRKHAMVM